MKKRVLSLMMALLLLWQLIPSVCLAAGGTADSSFVLAAATAGKVLVEPVAVSYTGSETLAQALKKSGYDLEGLDSGFVTKVQGVSGNYRRVDDAGGLSLDQPAKGVTFLAIVEIDLNAEQAAALGSLLKVMAAYRAFDTGVTRYPPAQEAYKAALEALYRADADASALQAALSGAMDRFDREVVNGKKVTAALTVQTLSGLDPASYTLDTEDSYGRTARFEKSQAIQLVPGAYSFQLQSGSDAQAVGTMTLTDSGVVQIGGETVTTLCLPDGEWLGEAVLHGGSVASGTYDHDGDTYYVADTDPSPYIYLPKGADAGDLSLNAGAVYTNTDGQAVEIPIAWASQAARLTGVLPVGTQAGRVTLKASLAYEGYVLSRLRTLCLERAPTLTARDDIKDNFKAEPLTTASEAVLTTKPDNLTDSMKKNNWFFQTSCPYPVLEWQEAEEHVISDEVIFDWTQDSATGLYSACVAKKLCQNCDYALSATLNVTRTVIREATTTQTGSVLYTATGYLEGKAVLDTKLVEMDKLTGPQVTELKLNKTSDTVTIGADAKEFADILFATVTAEEGADTTVYWFSGNTDLATVAPASADNHKCVITAKAAGTVTITASCGSKVVTFQLTILRNASGLTVTGPGGVTGKTLYMRPTDKKASTVQLTVTVQPEDATGIITWRSLDESVAMVDKNGLVTITGLGETTIEAKITNPDGTEITATFPIKCRTATAAKLKFYHDGKQVSADYTYSITKDLVMNLAGGETLYLDVEINPETFEWMGKTFKQPLPALTAYDSKQEGWLILQWVTEGEHAGQLAITNTAPGKNLTDKMLIKALIPGYESFSCVYFGVKLVDGTYTVNFDANGGEGAMTSQTLTYGKTSESLKANAFTKPGYTFAGWNTAADGTGTAYTNRQTTPNVTTENGGAVTLYAQWTANSYTVKFDGNGAEGTMADQSFTYDAEQALTANGFTKTGYTFAGWKLGDTTYEDGATVKNLATEGALTLTAQWTANSYTVKFDGNGAEGTMADQSFTYDVEQALTANGFTKTGYTFAGWKLGDTTYEDGATVKNLATSEEITLIAQWTAIKKDDGASTGDSGIIAWGAAMPVAVLAAAYVIGRKKREE